MTDPARPTSDPPHTVLWRRTVYRALSSAVLGLTVYLAALWFVAERGNPWRLGWLRPDEAAEIAEAFLLRQGADFSQYTLIRAVERRPEGVWRGGTGSSVSDARQAELRFDVNPAIGYLFRYFRTDAVDGWTIAVAPTGRIYRVQREQADDEPAARLPLNAALDLTLEKLATDLMIPASTLEITSNQLISQPQRSDWLFTFRWPEALDTAGTFTIQLSGTAVTGLSYIPGIVEPAPRWLALLQGSGWGGFELPNRSPRGSRLLGFALVLVGVFLIMHYHRTPLALKQAGLWGGMVFGLTLLVRGLTFSQSVMFMPFDSPLAGYVSRVALGGVIEALQNGLIMGLIIATGESLSRDVFRRATSLSRLAPQVPDWGAAWAEAARWGTLAATIVLLYEAAVAHYVAPMGLCSKAPALMANTLSSPLPLASLPLQIALDMFWDESLYRLWLLALLLFWLRLPLLAIPLAAGAATYFAGYDLSQFTSAGALLYLIWGCIAGLLTVRVSIIAAMVFHALVLGGYVALAFIWTGFGVTIGALLIITMLLIILWSARQALLPSASASA